MTIGAFKAERLIENIRIVIFICKLPVAFCTINFCVSAGEGESGTGFMVEAGGFPSIGSMTLFAADSRDCVFFSELAEVDIGVAAAAICRDSRKPETV